jgi:branched-chain amino acid transport system permease protein
MGQILQQIINALQLGSIYALIGIGYDMVYGIAKLINFAHGDIFMVSTYILFFAGTAFIALGFSSMFAFILAVLISMGATALLAVAIERFAYRPLRAAPRVSAVITALSVGLILENLTLGLIGPEPKKMPKFIQRFTIGTGSSLNLNSDQLIIIIAALIMMIILDRFVIKTKTGVAMRAVSRDKNASYLMGISVNKIISITFAIGAIAAAIAGVLFTIAYPLIDPYMGIMLGWWCFIAAVAGGIGNIRGAMLGGFILGFIMVFVPVFLPSSYRDLVAFLLLIIILVIKPSGILGTIETQKV